MWLACAAAAKHTLFGLLFSPLLHCCCTCVASQGDITLEFTWVDASGNVHVNDRHSPEGKGLAGGVGLIGIITEIKLQMTPPSNTKAVSINLLPDHNIGQEVLNYVKVWHRVVSPGEQALHLHVV